jgi:phosphoserine phosphatase RsbU/P
MNILIAEDDFTSRILLTGILKKEGHAITAVVNGAEAWHALQQPGAPSMVILDWIMPEMDGPEVVRCVRAMHTDRPPFIIMLTSKGEKVDIIAGLEAGANDYMAKPLDPGELRARINVGRRMLEMQDILACKVEELQQALIEIKTLRCIVPVCANCKNIKDEHGRWKPVEAYVRDLSEADLSHDICPDCAKKLYPKYYIDDAKKNEMK